MRTGLCSVTFRKLAVEEIVNLAVKAKLGGIEWGEDVHVPAGDLDQARKTARMTIQAGLNIVSYGSYYRVGCKEENTASFEEILQTAIELDAPTIRVWAGNRGSKDADPAYWENVVSDSRRIASLAQEHGISVSYEYHGGTLTDTNESAYRSMKEINHPNAGIYWQPAVGRDIDMRLEGLRRIAPWLTHVHVFHWENRNRLPLSDGEKEWKRYLRCLGGLKAEHYALLEFVDGDDTGQFIRDASVLERLITECGGS